MRFRRYRVAVITAASLILGCGIFASSAALAAKPATQADIDTAIAAAVPTHTVGDLYQGGIIVFLEDNGQHGLIAATHDQNPLDGNGDMVGVAARPGACCDYGASNHGLYGGAPNTAYIIARQGNGIYAAKVANDYSVQGDGESACTGDEFSLLTNNGNGDELPPVSETCYSDWYLPSNVEMLIVQRAMTAGQVAIDPAPFHLYWTSTQNKVIGSQNSMLLELLGYQGSSIDPQSATLPDGTPMRVRAVRRF